MLKQASLSDIQYSKIPQKRSHIVVTMRYYPRFLRKDLRDEYVCEMAPVKVLLQDFNKACKKLGDHNQAFDEVDYECRFSLSEKGLGHLKRLAGLSRKKNVYLVCVCKVGDRCHRELLLLMAKKFWKVKTDWVNQRYPRFEKRLAKSSGNLFHP